MLSNNYSLSKDELTAVRALQTYGAQRPMVTVTDQTQLRHLLRYNVRFNQSSPLPMWTATLPDEVPTSGWGAPWAGAPLTHRAKWAPTGLHAADADWGLPLSLPLSLLCGVRVEPGKSAKTAFERPPAASATAHPAFAAARKQLVKAYTEYPSLRLPTLPADEAAQLAGFTPGLDLIIGADCLYNERHFDEFRTTLTDLFTAHALAHAQIADVAGTDKAAAARPFPLVLISYPIRAHGEEERIYEMFFKPLQEEHGICHTAIPLTRLFETVETGPQAAPGRHVNDMVSQRMRERKEREDGITNQIQANDETRMRVSRMAVLYQIPHKSLPETSCPAELWQKSEGTGVLPSPLPLLTTNAQLLFRLFQNL